MFNIAPNQKGVSYWAIIIVLAAMVVAMIVAFWPQEDLPEDNLTPMHIRLLHQAKEVVGGISEKAKIEKWIVDNKLNQYGDPADTLYAGGTPLYDETTREMTNKYDYIKNNHPNNPWNK